MFVIKSILREKIEYQYILIKGIFIKDVEINNFSNTFIDNYMKTNMRVF